MNGILIHNSASKGTAIVLSRYQRLKDYIINASQGVASSQLHDMP